MNKKLKNPRDFQKTKRFLVITGNGKGKTTAALGLALRGWGYNYRIGIIHFVKSRLLTGEVKAIQKINRYVDIYNKQGKSQEPRVDQFIMGLGFLPKEGQKSPLFQNHKEMAINALNHAKSLLENQEYSILILDEICWAIHKELINEKDALELHGVQKMGTVLIFTGRNATPKIIQAADTVSEIQDIKHAYADQGFPAQMGVEK